MTITFGDCPVSVLVFPEALVVASALRNHQRLLQLWGSGIGRDCPIGTSRMTKATTMVQLLQRRIPTMESLSHLAPHRTQFRSMAASIGRRWTRETAELGYLLVARLLVTAYLGRVTLCNPKSSVPRHYQRYLPDEGSSQSFRIILVGTWADPSVLPALRFPSQTS